MRLIPIPNWITNPPNTNFVHNTRAVQTSAPSKLSGSRHIQRSLSS